MSGLSNLCVSLHSLNLRACCAALAPSSDDASRISSFLQPATSSLHCSFAYVAYATDAAADKAVATLHNQEVEGRKITVEKSKTPSESNIHIIAQIYARQKRAPFQPKLFTCACASLHYTAPLPLPAAPPEERKPRRERAPATTDPRRRLADLAPVVGHERRAGGGERGDRHDRRPRWRAGLDVQQQ